MAIAALAPWSAAESGVSARIDARAQLDDRFGSTEILFEQRAELRYVERDRRADLSFALREAEGDSAAELYEAAFGRRFPALDVRVGRSLRADSLGYYSLDGAELRLGREAFAWQIHAGSPTRIENYRSLEADSLVGVEARYTPTDCPHFALQQCAGRVGLQRLEAEGVEHRLGFGLDGRRAADRGALKTVGVAAAGTWIAERGGFEELSAETNGDFGERGRARLGYAQFEPLGEELSFRERFYRRYATGRQSRLDASVHYQSEAGRQFNLNLRRVSHERGPSGYGATLGNTFTPRPNWSVQTQADGVWLGGDRVLGLYGEAVRTLSYRSRAALAAVLQTERKRIEGDDITFGLEADIERMLRSDLYLSFYGRRIWHSRLDEEYRLGVRLSHSFDGRRPEARP